MLSIQESKPIKDQKRKKKILSVSSFHCHRTHTALLHIPRRSIETRSFSLSLSFPKRPLTHITSILLLIPRVTGNREYVHGIGQQRGLNPVAPLAFPAFQIPWMGCGTRARDAPGGLEAGRAFSVWKVGSSKGCCPSLCPLAYLSVSAPLLPFLFNFQFLWFSFPHYLSFLLSILCPFSSPYPFLSLSLSLLSLLLYPSIAHSPSPTNIVPLNKPSSHAYLELGNLESYTWVRWDSRSQKESN